MPSFMGILAMVIVVVSGCEFRFTCADDGTATYYTPPYVPSACDGYQDDGVMIAAASDAIWGNGAVYGSYYEVTCTGATNKGDTHPCTGESVIVRVVNYCPNCRGTIDLSQESFSSIANTDAGKIKIQLNQQ